jgi:glycine dehydrogenase subunit 1
MAVRVAAYLSAVGPRGASQIASMCLDKAHYAADQIAALPGFEMRFRTPFFKEFVVRTSKNIDALLSHCSERSILAGVSLGRWYPELGDCLLIAVTEKRSREEIDALVQALDEV